MTNLLTAYTAPPTVEQKVETPKQKSNSKRVTIGSVVGAAAGIAAGVATVYGLAKKGNPATTLMNLNYAEKDVLIVGAGAVLGGLAGGLLTDTDKNNTKPKLREASQQFFGNMVCPIGLLAAANKIYDACKINIPDVIKTGSKAAGFVNNAVKYLPKAAITVGALVGGMELGNTIMNKINNKIFKEKVKHDVKKEDYLVHADDLCLTANMLFKDTPNISKVTSKILPLTFIVAGSKSGMKKAD
ncbi:hypothetical protein II906_03440 [bacterium]|nr:hypothetical protein [bacterium]